MTTTRQVMAVVVLHFIMFAKQLSSEINVPVVDVWTLSGRYHGFHAVHDELN